MRKLFRGILKFGMAFFVMTIVNTIAWEIFVDGKLYNCTDAVGIDYLKPGDWVHEWGNFKIETVPHVVRDSDMSHPDTIQEGWTVTRLWYLWFAFFATSVFISTALARSSWSPLGRNLHNRPRNDSV